MKTLWIDILCWESAVKAVTLVGRQGIGEVYYINRALSFPRGAVVVLQKILKVPLRQADTVVEGDERIGESSLFELIYLKLTELVDQFVSRSAAEQGIKEFSRQRGCNPLKFKEHLREALCPYFFKIAEMMFLALQHGNDKDSVYLVRCSFVCAFLEKYIGSNKSFFYRPYCGLLGGIDTRAEYLWDNSYNKIYGLPRLALIFQLWGHWLGVLINSFLIGLLSGKTNGPKSNTLPAANIGVDFIQSRFRLDAINDIYWLEGSGIDPKTVYGIEYEPYDDAESKKGLTSLGINRNKYYYNPLTMLREAMRSFSKREARLLAPDVSEWLRILPDVASLWHSIFLWGEKAWIRYQYVSFKLGVTYWQSIYRQCRVRILWSMFDVEPQKLIKAQAMENMDGLFMGSHWSNFSMIALVNDQKCYDVFITWNQYFIKNIFVQYPFLKVFFAGYPLDFYFTKHKEEAENLRKKYAGKFILSFHDNAISKDYPYTKSMQVAIHRMLLDLLRQYNDLVIFLKPKRRSTWEEVLSELSELNLFIEQGRIVVFLGDSTRTKAIPAKIGMASDLAVGMGSATAAMECFFAGTVSFYIDLTNFVNNEFINRGLGVIAFRDIVSLKQAVERQITGENRITHAECQKYYEMLDPFQDGKAYYRTGFILKRLQEGFEQGKNREEALKYIEEEYQEFCSGQRKGQESAATYAGD